jgi:hypothetical protein
MPVSSVGRAAIYAAACFFGFKDLANLVIGFALLVLLVLLVRELSASHGRRER